MEFKFFGNTSLEISSLGLGTMTFGDGADAKEAQKIYNLAREYGINFFDCANVYAQGESERILGSCIKGHRDEVVVTSKAYFSTGQNRIHSGGHRKHLRKSIDDSLKRLKTDYLDIFYLHRFDDDGSLEDSLEFLNHSVHQGKILYLGVSNFSAWQTMKAIHICRENSWHSLQCIQPMYNLLKRQCESEILPMARSENLAVSTYSPLAGGVLTKKYLDTNSHQGRLHSNERYLLRYQNHQLEAKPFFDFCGKNNLDPMGAAINWVRKQSGITNCILGARNSDQFKQQLESIEKSVSSDFISKISDLTPSPAPATDRNEENILSKGSLASVSR